MALSLAVGMAGVSGAVSGTSSGGAHGNGAQITHYTATYTDPLMGPVSCVGVHQVKSGAHGANFVQDSFTCTSTSGSPLTGVTAGESLSLYTFGIWYYGPTYVPNSVTEPVWFSDFNGASAVSFSGTVSLDGYSYSAVAGY